MAIGTTRGKIIFVDRMDDVLQTIDARFGSGREDIVDIQDDGRPERGLVITKGNGHTVIIKGNSISRRIFETMETRGRIFLDRDRMVMISSHEKLARIYKILDNNETAEHIQDLKFYNDNSQVRIFPEFAWHPLLRLLVLSVHGKLLFLSAQSAGEDARKTIDGIIAARVQFLQQELEMANAFNELSFDSDKRRSTSGRDHLSMIQQPISKNRFADLQILLKSIPPVRYSSGLKKI
jgi:hypothetical protein